MYSSWIIIILVFGLIAVLISLFWIFNSTSSVQNSSIQFGSDLISMRENIVNDSHLHRLLMIEIIHDKAETFSKTELPNNEQIRNQHKGSSLPSEAVTFSKMATGITLFGKTLIRSFGVAIAQRIATLMHKRNEILRDYYWALRNMTCSDGECVVDLNDKHENKILRPVFPPAFLSQEYKNGILDITTLTERKLEAITREITDQVAASFDIRDVDQSASRSRPIVHFQRLFNLITMYDKELVNQAKSYAAEHYDISMNCAQSSLEITQHISDEFGVLMKESTEKVKSLA